MKTKIEEIWDKAAADARVRRPRPDELRLIRTDATSAVSIYAGVDGLGHPLLAIGLTGVPPSFDVVSSSFEYFRQQRSGGAWIMALRLNSPGLESVFGRLCQDLADEATAASDEHARIQLFHRRLHLWARLFSEGLRGLLPSYRVRGLVAELFTLENLLAVRSQEEVVAAWIGPQAADQDFVFIDVAYEIKALHEKASAVSISSLGQLDSRVPLELHVFTLRTSPVHQPESVTLNALVARIESTLSLSSAALTLFKDRLLEAGYVERVEYELEHHKVDAHQRFAVSALFPRLTRDNVAPAITNAAYSLSLSSLASFRLEGQ